MDRIEFWKMNGSGNDFILIDNREGRIPEHEMERLVKSACRRRESVGADGVIFVVPSDRFDFGWRFFNPDGAEVEMCGNGGRCVSRFAFLKGIAGPTMTFDTLAGPISSEVSGRTVKVLMPRPTGLSLNLDMNEGKGWKTVDFVNTGVPHVVIGIDDLSEHPIIEEGRRVRYHHLFAPNGTNADFVRYIDKGRLEVRTYERGVEDETLACGTGAIASALISSVRGMSDSPVRVKTRGGEELVIHFEKKGESFEKVWLEGDTSVVYQGLLHEEAL